MTARSKLARGRGSWGSLPVAAALVLAGLALISVAANNDGLIETEGTPTGSTIALDNTSVPTTGTTLTAETPAAEEGEVSADPGDDGSATGPDDTGGETSDSPDSGPEVTTDQSLPGDLQPDSTQGDETQPDSPTTAGEADDLVTDEQPSAVAGQPVDPEASDDPGATDSGDELAQPPSDDDSAEAQDSLEQTEAEAEAAATAAAAAREEESGSSLTQILFMAVVALIAVLGLVSLLAPAVSALAERWRAGERGERLRTVVWKWLRSFWRDDDEADDVVDVLPLMSPVVMLDRLRHELESQPDPRHAVRQAYSVVESGFGNSEMARHKSETPTAYLSRALGTIGDSDNRPLAQLTYLFLLARYSQHDITEPMRLEAVEAVIELRTRYRQSEEVLV